MSSELLSVNAVQNIVKELASTFHLTNVQPRKHGQQITTKPIQQAVGYRSYEQVRSHVQIPQFPTSQRDGFAWKTCWLPSDIITVRKDVEMLAQPSPSTSSSTTSSSSSTSDNNKANNPNNYLNFNYFETCYVATGGIVPNGFDCIVMFEEVESADGENSTRGIGSNRKILDATKIMYKKDLSYLSPLSPSCTHRYIRTPGSDINVGTILLDENECITPTSIALCISVGIRELKVKTQGQSHPLLTIGVMSSGNEVRDISQTLTLLPGEIYDTNRPMLLTLLRERFDQQRLNIIDLGIAPDQADVLEQFIKQAYDHQGCDVVLSTGGASVGKKDFTLSVLNKLSFDVYTTKVNMMPGKPFVCAQYKQCMFFGMAGNPVASAVSFYLYIEPFVYQTLSGKPHVRKVLRCKSAFSCKSSDPTRPEYHRVQLTREIGNNENGQWIASSTGRQASSTLLSLRCADGLVCVSSNEPIVEGQLIDVICLQDINTTEFNKVKVNVESCRPKVHITNINTSSSSTSSVSTSSSSLNSSINSVGCKIGILTASDRAYNGIYEDLSGVKIRDFLEEKFVLEHEIVYICVPDEMDDIENAINVLLQHGCGLILTTGGTGPAKRDVTIDVMKKMIHKELPGFGELMRTMSLKYVPTAILSAQTAGIIYRNGYIERTSSLPTSSPTFSVGTLVINLPGSPKSIYECMEVILGAIPYAVELCGGGMIETNPPAFRGKRVV